MKPETFAELEKMRDMELNQDARRAPMAKHNGNGDGGRPESCITSLLTEAQVHPRFEELRSFLYVNGRDGEHSETRYLLSEAVHSFSHES